MKRTTRRQKAKSEAKPARFTSLRSWREKLEKPQAVRLGSEGHLMEEAGAGARRVRDFEKKLVKW